MFLGVCASLLLLTCAIECRKNNMYKVQWERFETHTYDKDFAEIDGRCVYANRTTKAMELDAELKQDMNESFAVNGVFFKWINNNWVKYSALQINENVKTVLKIEWFDLQSLFKKHCTPPITWPWKKTKYAIRNFIFNPEEFPPYIPVGNYKVLATFYTSRKKTNKLFQLDFYVNLIPLKPNEKN